jgi:hypothetical protein
LGPGPHCLPRNTAWRGRRGGTVAADATVPHQGPSTLQAPRNSRRGNEPALHNPAARQQVNVVVQGKQQVQTVGSVRRSLHGSPPCVPQPTAKTQGCPCSPSPLQAANGAHSTGVCSSSPRNLRAPATQEPHHDPHEALEGVGVGQPGQVSLALSPPLHDATQTHDARLKLTSVGSRGHDRATGSSADQEPPHPCDCCPLEATESKGREAQASLGTESRAGIVQPTTELSIVSQALCEVNHSPATGLQITAPTKSCFKSSENHCHNGRWHGPSHKVEAPRHALQFHSNRI